MKTIMIAGTIARLTTAGAGAAAGDPMVLTNAELDQVTAGPTLTEYALLLAISGDRGREPLSINFKASSRTEEIEVILGGFTEIGVREYNKTVGP
jgi:hypothetical protein